jgi:hypothetical protein
VVKYYWSHLELERWKQFLIWRPMSQLAYHLQCLSMSISGLPARSTRRTMSTSGYSSLILSVYETSVQQLFDTRYLFFISCHQTGGRSGYSHATRIIKETIVVVDVNESFTSSFHFLILHKTIRHVYRLRPVFGEQQSEK